MQKPPTKKQLRESLEKDLMKFVKSGGDVTEVPKGVSGRDNGSGMPKPESWHMDKSTGERTQIPEVLKALDARKSTKAAPTTTNTRKKRARKKLIYDDFGEPLRWVWVEE